MQCVGPASYLIVLDAKGASSSVVAELVESTLKLLLADVGMRRLEGKRP